MRTDLSDLVVSFRESIMVLRHSTGCWNGDGVYESSPASKSLRIDAVALPVRGRELEAVPEGLRGFENKQFITTEPLQAAGSDGHDSDVVVHGASHYRIHTVTDWSQAGFSVAIGAREEDA